MNEGWRRVKGAAFLCEGWRGGPDRESGRLIAPLGPDLAQGEGHELLSLRVPQLHFENFLRIPLAANEVCAGFSL